MSQPQSAEKVVLVTGASSGIGLASSIALARAGWRVVATMRNLERSAALRDAAGQSGVDIDLQPLDVTDENSVGAIFDHLRTTYGRVDVVVNNAGAASVGTVETMPPADIRSAMEVNYFGVVAVTRAAMPFLRATRGHVVTISSVGGVVGQPFNEAYCAAKFAVEGFLESLSPVAKTVGVRVSLIEPGAVASAFVENAQIDQDASVADAGPYAQALKAYFARTMQQFDPASAQSPDQVAELIVTHVADPEPAFRVQTSSLATDFVKLKLSDLDGSRVTGMTASWLGD